MCSNTRQTKTHITKSSSISLWFADSDITCKLIRSINWVMIKEMMNTRIPCMITLRHFSRSHTRCWEVIMAYILLPSKLVRIRQTIFALTVSQHFCDAACHNSVFKSVKFIKCKFKTNYTTDQFVLGIVTACCMSLSTATAMKFSRNMSSVRQ